MNNTEYIEPYIELGVERYGLDPTLPWDIFFLKLQSYVALDREYVKPIFWSHPSGMRFWDRTLLFERN